VDETKIYSVDDILDAKVARTIKEVISDLEEKGYDPIKQIVGYLVTIDPAYISNYKDARKKLTKIELSKFFEVLLKDFIK